MGISINTIISSTPKQVLHRYFDIHPVELSEEIDWDQDEKLLNKAMTTAIKGLSKQLYDPMHLHFERLHGWPMKRASPLLSTPVNSQMRLRSNSKRWIITTIWP